VTAQYADKDFTRYSVRDGLSDNNITCLQQDDEGYIWIGTNAGLNRFDGNTFKKFYQGTLPLQIPSSNIVRLKRFGKHELGIITRGGFQLINTKDYAVQNFLIPDNTPFTTQLNATWDAEQLADGSYAATSAAGFYVFDKYGKVKLRHDAYQVSDIGRKRILYGRDILKMPGNKYLAYIEENKIGIYDNDKKSYTETDSSDKLWNMFLRSDVPYQGYWLVKYQVNSTGFIFIRLAKDSIDYYDHLSKKLMTSPLPFHVIDELSWESKIQKLNDSIFVLNCRSNGFYFIKLDPLTGRIYCDGQKFLANYKVVCLFFDKDKRLWAGTNEGLLKQELYPPVIKAYRYPPPKGEKFTGGFTCTYSYKNKLYAGRFSLNKGFAIMDATTMKLIKEIDFFDTRSRWNEIYSIEMYHTDTLWIGTNTGLLWYDTKTGRYGKLLDEKKYPWGTGFSAVLSAPRHDGYAWMCSILGGKVVRYHIPSRTFTLFTSQTKPALPFDRVKKVVYDSYGDVWISGHSLARWNNKLQDFDTMITVYGGVNKYNDDIVAITSDANGSLWLHNAQNGLLEYKIKEKKFIAFSMKDGLPSNVLQSISPVVDNKLWVAANSQIGLFDLKTKNTTIYDIGDGLPEQNPTGRNINFDPGTGYLYLCNNEYIVKFPFAPEKKPDHSSGIIIEEIGVQNKRTFFQPSAGLSIKYNENNLLLNYTVIDFEKSNYQFAYRLNNSENWNVIGGQRSINLSNLPPGNYSVQLKASGKPGLEKTKEFSFVVQSPFWKTTWFISIVALLFALTIYFLYRRRIYHIRQKANIDKQLSQTEMKALQAQMNPHFIFNSLNSIREMILNNENKEASHYLSKFAHLIRITLDQSSQSLVSLRNTIDYLERYMEMENIRNSLFTHEITTDADLDADETLVPPMLIQPFIENAIWHGISASKKNIHVTIHFKKENEKLICTIDDNGMGIEQSQKNRPNNTNRHKAVGIVNIKNRVKLLNEKYDLHAQISIIDKKDIPGCTEKGTLVTLQLPLEIKES
jgi:ligand-binding sensor domain-containing protein/two-component sensor histidine kinase